MSIPIVAPEVGESVVDARVARWLKREGDAVAAGEALVELETDKINVEVSAPQAGVLEKITHGPGADVKIGEVLGTLAPGAAPAKATAAAPAASATPARPEAPAPAGAARAASAPAPAAAPVPAAAPAVPGPSPSAIPATPSARKLARDERVDLTSVQPAGPRVTVDDVRRAAAGSPATAVSARTSAGMAMGMGVSTGARTETRVRMSKRRATIAKRLVQAQQTAAMLTTFNDIDMSAVMALRARHKESFKARYGVSLGIVSFFVRASIVALREIPRLNAEIQGDEMVLKQYYDIGVAVGTEEGLVVPVLRDADRMSFARMEQGIRDFASRASAGKLTIEDLTGGTFSITNGGVYGSLMSTPILSPPQVGILGLHAINERPVGVNGQIVLRPMMYVALTYDHRIVDGAEAVRFLVRVKTLIEDPASLAIEA